MSEPDGREKYPRAVVGVPEGGRREIRVEVAGM